MRLISQNDDPEFGKTRQVDFQGVEMLIQDLIFEL